MTSSPAFPAPLSPLPWLSPRISCSSGNALRSTLPFNVRGNSFISTYALGTITSGNCPPRYSRNPTLPPPFFITTYAHRYLFPLPSSRSTTATSATPPATAPPESATPPLHCRRPPPLPRQPYPPPPAKTPLPQPVRPH